MNEKPLCFLYRNRKGETDVRFVKPIQIYFGSTEHYKEPQWLMKAWDVVKEAERTFAMLDIIHFINNEAKS